MRVEITFHGPFRVETGSTRDGVAATVDHDDLLPASSLKGLMRASAALLLPDRPDLVAEVFGGRAGPGRPVDSPWHWEAATFDEPPVFDQRGRVSIDPLTGAGRHGAFFLAEEVWASGASFEVTRYGRLEPGAEARHLTVLAGAAAGVHALGSDRRRGLGWVTFRPTDPVVDEELLSVFEALRSRPASSPASGEDRHA